MPLTSSAHATHARSSHGSRTASAAHYRSRVVCVVPLDAVPCLHCGARLKDTGTITPLGRTRCVKCNHMTYFIPAPAAELAIVFTVTAAELRHAIDHGMTTAEMLAYFGLAEPFVSSPLMAAAG